MKTFFLFILLGIATLCNAFTTKISITISQSDAKIYVDDVYKANGHHEFSSELKQFVIRVEKSGYKTEIRKYKYHAFKNSGFLGFERGDPLNIIIIMYEDNGTDNNSTNVNASASIVDKTQELMRLETLKSDGLVSSDESLMLKDNLLSDNADNNDVKAIDELTKLRKIMNTGFISKEDFITFKNKIIRKQYDYNKGNRGSDKLNTLKVKSESGDYSKDEIERLKRQLVISYK